MFVNDTDNFIKGKSLDIITTVLNCELYKLCDWFAANLLSLNVKKTNNIIFVHQSFEDIPLNMNGESLSRVNETKCLGVFINLNLCLKDRLKYWYII